jgi:hypothetical protein
MNYTIVTNELIETPDLSPVEKLILIVVSRLSQQETYCTASNEYIGQMVGCNAQPAQRAVLSLIGKGYLTSEVKFIPTLNKKRRYLKVTDLINVTVKNSVSKVVNSPAFIADVNSDKELYKIVLTDVVKDRQSSRNILFMQYNIDMSKAPEMWSEFIINAALHSPRIIDTNHAWNIFKNYVSINHAKYQYKEQDNKLNIGY